MEAEGSLLLSDRRIAWSATWFDHQWGDFISVGGGGWDWFAVNLEDGTDLTLSLVRDADRSYPWSTARSWTPRATRHLERDAFTTATRQWTGPTTGATYPAAQVVRCSRRLTIDLEPTVAAQELDTRSSTGVVYWEGSQIVQRAAWVRRVDEAYVELTGYGPAGVAP